MINTAAALKDGKYDEAGHALQHLDFSINYLGTYSVQILNL
jgi:hypothetical protein